MSTRRTSQEIVNVEVKLPAQIYTSQLTESVEVKLPQQMNISQLIVSVEVETAYNIVTFGPRVQAS